jgi:hypothetical protein
MSGTGGLAPSPAAIRARILALAQRARGSICPSQVARSFFAARAAWTPLMPLIRSEAAEIIGSGGGGGGGRLVCTQRGVDVGLPTEVRGPLRLRWVPGAG